MESDMVVAVRHRDVPGDLTRSSTCNKTNATRSFVTLQLIDLSSFLMTMRTVLLSSLNLLQSALTAILRHCNRWEKARRRRSRRILRAILATVDGELSNR